MNKKCKTACHAPVDNPNDWSSSEGEIGITWVTDKYEDFGIFEGDDASYLIDYDRVDTHNELVCEICRQIGKEYPDLDFEVEDFEIVGEDAFWKNRSGDSRK